MKAFYLLIVLVMIASKAYAYIGFNVCNYGAQTLSAVVCYGPTVLKQTTVTGDVKVAGTFDATGVSMAGLIIAGNVTIADSKVTGNAEVIGSLHAKRVIFQQNVTVTSADIDLSQTNIKGSLNITSKDTNPTLSMACGTVVKGGVTFNGKAGILQITDDSAVQGKIVNGSMEFVKKPCNL